MFRILHRLFVVVLVFFSVHPALAGTAYRLGVLRGPTAVAFAPMLESPVRLADGRTVEIRLYPDPPALTAAYLAGDVDAATLPSNVAAQLSARGQTIEVGATFIWGVLYLIGPRDVSLGDLSGPVHSLGRGATPDIVLRYVLAQEGLSIKCASSTDSARSSSRSCSSRDASRRVCFPNLSSPGYFTRTRSSES
jgi:ABC-type nitrate/sulfonate/bicarbonate transport system substrate-binding protein